MLQEIIVGALVGTVIALIFTPFIMLKRWADQKAAARRTQADRERQAAERRDARARTLAWEREFASKPVPPLQGRSASRTSDRD